MKANPLLQLKGPWLHILVATESEACDRLWALRKPASAMVVGRLIRGHKAKTTAALFDEFAAALQFPCYFGENWDALDECLSDLEWLPGKAYVLLITNSDRLLEEETPDELSSFLRLLAHIAEDWSTRSAKPFHVVLQCSQQQESRLRHSLHAAHVAHDEL